MLFVLTIEKRKQQTKDDSVSYSMDLDIPSSVESNLGKQSIDSTCSANQGKTSETPKKKILTNTSNQTEASIQPNCQKINSSNNINFYRTRNNSTSS